MTMADRIVVMNAGRIEQVGGPETLYDAPVNLFVAGFIGSPGMNFLDGTVLADGRLQVDRGPLLPLPMRLDTGRRLTLGVRPEHVRLATPGEADSFEVRVVSVEPTGVDTHLVCDLAGTTLTVSVRERVRPRPGDNLAIAFETERLHCFDPTSGLTLVH